MIFIIFENRLMKKGLWKINRTQCVFSKVSTSALYEVTCIKSYIKKLTINY